MPFSELESFGVDEFTPELLPFFLQIEMSEIFLLTKQLWLPWSRL